MTQAIDSHGNVVTPQSNVHSGEERIITRDVQAEKEAVGYYAKASSFIPDDEANNNLDVVMRDGSRVHAGGDYRPDDVLMIDGMEVTYEIAQQVGLIRGAQVTPGAQEEILGNSENTPGEDEQADTRPEQAQLLEMQLDLATNGEGQRVMEIARNDIVHLGDFSEDTLNMAATTLGMNEGSLREIYSDMQDVGTEVMADFLETGDGHGQARLEFLANLSEIGNRDQQATVRNLWFLAATGRLTREQAAEAFDHLRSPYD